MKNKEEALKDYLTMIAQSWTWARLTKEEQQKFIELLCEERNKKTVRGNYHQRFDAYNSFYDFFINALGYKPIGWRGE